MGQFLCKCVFVCAERHWETAEVAIGVSYWPQERQQNTNTFPIGWLASVSDPIGSGSERDGVFWEVIGSCHGGMHRSCDHYGLISLSLTFASLLCVCVCEHLCSEAAVFANVFPCCPPRGVAWVSVCVWVSERGKIRRMSAFRQLQCNSGLPPIQTAYWWVALRTECPPPRQHGHPYESPCQRSCSELTRRTTRWIK